MKILQSIDSEKKYLLFIFLVALCIRLIYVIFLSPQILSPDSYDWLNIASGLASGQGYGDTWRPPGYATFLGVIIFLFGKSIGLIKIINSLLGALTCLSVYYIGKKIFSPAVGRISAMLLCFYPYLIAYAGDLLSETFYTFLISLSILLIFITGELPNTRNMITTGFIFGITALTKSTILPFFFLACLWLWWTTKKIRTGFIAGIFTLLVLAPWTVRNYLYYKKIILISPAYQSLAKSNNDEAMILETVGEKNEPAPDDFKFTPEKYVGIDKLPRMESETIYKKEYDSWVKNNPEKFRWLVKKRLIHFWRLYPMMAYKWQKVTAMFTSGIYIPLCFIGIILSIKHFKKTSLLIFLFLIYTWVHLFFAVVLRYRVPIDPYIIIFASYTIHFLWIKLKSYILLRV